MASEHPQATDTGPHPLVRSIPSHGSSLTGPLNHVRRQALVPLNTVLLGGALLLGGLALGVFIATHGAVLTASEPGQADGQVMASTISRLETDQANLYKQIAGLQSKLADAKAKDSENKSSMVTIDNELSRER